MLLISWNVAGWESTCKYIEQYYGTPAQYFERHGAHDPKRNWPAKRLVSTNPSRFPAY